jgi:hypothetical protein
VSGTYIRISPPVIQTSLQSVSLWAGGDDGGCNGREKICRVYALLATKISDRSIVWCFGVTPWVASVRDPSETLAEPCQGRGTAVDKVLTVRIYR